MPFDSVPPHEAWADQQETTTVTVDGHDLSVAYYHSGSYKQGPPVVFLHGIPTWSFLWHRIAPEFVEHRELLAPDLLGYGNSAMADGFDRSIRAQEAMLDALLEEFDADSVALVGHDVGGGVALRYAAHNPDAVESLVLSNAVCYDSWPVEFINDLGVPDRPEEMDQADLDDHLDGAFRGGLYAEDPDEEFVEGMKAAWRGEQARVSLTRCAVATNTNHTTELDYGAIEADTLLLWGADDVLQPVEYAERLAGDVAGDAEVRPLDDAYHWVTQDRTAAYVEALHEFLVGGV